MSKLIADKSVLIVEDELIIALDLKTSLKKLGFTVLNPVNTGEKAITCTKSLSPSIVIMDVNLKGKMNGVDAAKKILSMNIPVVFLTAQNDSITLTHINRLSCPVLLKPFNIFSLKSTIEEVLNSDQKMSRN